jgi:hypothetical protein
VSFASFETPASRARVFLYIIKKITSALRSAPRETLASRAPHDKLVRLEGRRNV